MGLPQMNSLVRAAVVAFQLLFISNIALAQFPPVSAPPPPTIPAIDPAQLAAAQQAAGAFGPTSAAPAAASTANPTLLDFLGVHQVGDAVCDVSKGVHELPIVQVVDQTVLHPVLRATGLMPVPGLGTLEAGADPLGAAGGGAAAGGAGANAGGGEPPIAGGEQTTPPPSPEALSGSIMAEQDPEKIKVKVEAIRFLGKQDCLCYPEVMDALLASLDDCSELIRYEALRAIYGGCSAGQCHSCEIPSSQESGGTTPCKCQLKVIRRVSRLLLDRNVNGNLKERSVRVRHLARLILERCLCSVQPTRQPAVRPTSQPDPPIQLPLR